MDIRGTTSVMHTAIRTLTSVSLACMRSSARMRRYILLSWDWIACEAEVEGAVTSVNEKNPEVCGVPLPSGCRAGTEGAEVAKKIKIKSRRQKRRTAVAGTAAAAAGYEGNGAADDGQAHQQWGIF
jgi:hypothetical protein